MVSLVAVALFSCSKDNDEKNDTPTAVEAAVNTLVINGTTYQLESRYSIDEGGRSYADANTIATNANEDPLFNIISDVEENTLNKTYDLTQLVEGEIIFFSIRDANYFTEDGLEIDPYSFTSGTLTINRDENLFVYKVKGIVEGGKPVSFNISVPASEWNQPE